MKQWIMEIIKERKQAWGIALAIGLLFAFLGKACHREEIVIQQITVNAPQAMHEAFEKTIVELEFDDRYELEFTNSKEANFTVTTKKVDSKELIAYSPMIAVINSDTELYNRYIKEEICVLSDTEPNAYDLDFQKIIKDITENPDSKYKVYYPDETVCDQSVLYAFLLCNANDGYYPSEGVNMVETKEIVNAFLRSKKTEPISLEAVYKI